MISLVKNDWASNLCNKGTVQFLLLHVALSQEEKMHGASKEISMTARQQILRKPLFSVEPPFP